MNEDILDIKVINEIFNRYHAGLVTYSNENLVKVRFFVDNYDLGTLHRDKLQDILAMRFDGKYSDPNQRLAEILVLTYERIKLKENLLKNQKNCPPEFINIVNENFWDLF